MSKLRDGRSLPGRTDRAPGPKSRRWSLRLAASEAPGVNTLVGGEAAVVWEEACGSVVQDTDGNRYVDLTSGFGAAAVGHRHAKVVAAVRAQAGRLLHGLGDVAAHPLRIELAERIASLAPVEDARCYYAVSGADAVEVALKTALLFTGRSGVLAFDPAYHGLTLGALATTSRRGFREPFAEHLRGHVRRLPFGCAPDRVKDLLGGSADVGAVIVEPIVGREGVLIPPAGWLKSVSEVCARYGALLIADEILTGFGRTGAWFVSAGEGVQPDLLCCGKALGGGMPIAMTVGRQEIMSSWERGGEALHTGTFIAHPLACAAAHAVLDLLEEEQLVERAAELGRLVEERIQEWPNRFPEVVEARGRGLLWGIEVHDVGRAAAVVSEARARGVLLIAGGPEGRVLEVLPPLTITRRQLESALETLSDCLAKSAGGR